MLLIINSDDFGYEQSVNLGIIEAHKNGVLTSATLMPNMQGFDNAIKLSKENENLGVGVHLVLTCGKPILDPKEVSTLIDENGNFKNVSNYHKDYTINLDEVYNEWKAQINKVIETGIMPTHLDSHHHINVVHGINDVFEQLSREYKLPVRNNYNVSKDLVTTKGFYDLDNLPFKTGFWKEMEITNFIKYIKICKTVEAMCHVGYIGPYLQETSSFIKVRPLQVKELTNIEFLKILNDEGIKLGTYRDL